MGSLLIAVIYLIFISLGLPDSLLGSGWPAMRAFFGVPSSFAGYVSMTISFMTIISALLSPRLMRKMQTKWIVIISIMLTVAGLLGFSICTEYWMLFLMAVPYGLGAGAIDASINNYVAMHYSGAVMNFLHCFYGVGAMISPYIMAAALRRARWNEGYRWTAYLQIAILVVCILSLPLWKRNQTKEEEETLKNSAGIREVVKIPGAVQTLIAFFAYCSGEATCFLWVPSFFAGTKKGLRIFGGLMLGRLIAGFISNHFGDRKMIRMGIVLELMGILVVILPFPGYMVTAVGFVMIGTGMGPVYPAIQHMAPRNFGRKNSAAMIGLQMASAYVGSTFMPMVFGLLQETLGIWIMPWYLLMFALINIGMLELSYRKMTLAD